MGLGVRTVDGHIMAIDSLLMVPSFIVILRMDIVLVQNAGAGKNCLVRNNRSCYKGDERNT